jgi:hypothetical protein
MLALKKLPGKSGKSGNSGKGSLGLVLLAAIYIGG